MDSLASEFTALPLGLFEKALPPGLTWHERLRTVRKIGFDFIELSLDDSDERIARLDWNPAERAQLRRAAVDTGVPILSMSLSAHRRFALGSASATQRQRGLDILKKAIDFSVDVGLRYVQICGADAYHEGSSPDTRARFLESLACGVEWAASVGVMLALENWDRGIDSVTEAMAYVVHFNSPWFQHYVDIGNLAYTGYDVVSELTAGRGHIVAVHARDVRPEALWGVPLGTGMVPFVEVFAKLAEMDFQGPVVLAVSTGDDPGTMEKAGNWLRARMEEGWRLFEGIGPT